MTNPSRQATRTGLVITYTIMATLFLTLLASSCKKSPDTGSASTGKHPPFKESEYWSAARDENTSSYCRQCHEDVFEDWAQSHHALANRLLDPGHDDLPFSTEFPGTHPDGTLSFSKSEGQYQITIRDPEGEIHHYHPDMALAYTPLHQYLVPFPGGRWQATQIAWDPEREEWFDVYDDDRQPGEWGHWQGRGMNWNSRCAWCHMTGYDKNYHIEEDAYQSRWIEQGISCVQCHGTMDNHGEAARKEEPDLKIPRLTATRVMHNCASCHSRREELTGDFQPGDNYHEHFRLQLMENAATYYPDGQIRDEVFVYGSFLQSRMHAAGVRCMDCHDPHTQELRHPVRNNQLCQTCHGAPGRMNAPRIDPIEHSHHPEGSSGNRCVECHMPQTTYMQRDPRRDHGFHIPDPLMTRELGIPNACNRCHTDQSTDWAMDAVDSWFGEKMERPERERTRAIARAQNVDPQALQPVLDALERETIPIWRATLIALLQPWAGEPQVRLVVERALEEEFPLTRAAALRVLGQVPGNRERIRSFLGTTQPRMVRITAAQLLQEDLDPESQAFREYRHFLDFNADQPTGASRIAQFHFSRNQVEKATEWMRKAVEYDPYSPPLHRDLAIMEQVANRSEAAEESLLRARELDPKNPEYPFSLGLLYAETRNLEKAVQSLREAVTLDPGFHRAHYNLGLAYVRQQKRLSALRSLQKAIELQPRNPDYHYAIATLYLDYGDSDSAREALESALRSDPTHAPSRRLLQRLNQTTE